MQLDYYYMKAVYPSALAAQEAAPRITAFLARMHEASFYWRRAIGDESEQPLHDGFGDVIRTLGITRIKSGGSWRPVTNALRGPVSSLEWSGVITEGNVLMFEAPMPQHTNWDQLANALKKTFGATRAGWICELNSEIDYYPLITLK